jgi:hypothetical protein
MSLLRLIVLRRVLRFYRPLVSIAHGRDKFEYVLAILTAVGSQWLIGIILCTLFLLSFYFDIVRIAYPIFLSHVQKIRSSRIRHA